ncbi:MAG: hypothetical protein GEU71_07445 [Actinobacteria bacterium]|nr:hypothetical protein [Actinomycetota bacterium]
MRGDYFDRARTLAVTLLVLAGAMAIAGSFLDWTTQGELPEEILMQQGGGLLAELSEPVTGFDAGDGKVAIGAAVFVLVGALLLAVTRQGRYGLLALVASMVIGAVAIAAYRSLDDTTSDFFRKLDLAGEIDPGIGLILCAVAGLLGVLAGALGMISSPKESTG